MVSSQRMYCSRGRFLEPDDIRRSITSIRSVSKNSFYFLFFIFLFISTMNFSVSFQGALSAHFLATQKSDYYFSTLSSTFYYPSFVAIYQPSSCKILKQSLLFYYSLCMSYAISFRIFQSQPCSSGQQSRWILKKSQFSICCWKGVSTMLCLLPSLIIKSNSSLVRFCCCQTTRQQLHWQRSQSKLVTPHSINLIAWMTPYILAYSG